MCVVESCAKQVITTQSAVLSVYHVVRASDVSRGVMPCLSRAGAPKLGSLGFSSWAQSRLLSFLYLESMYLSLCRCEQVAFTIRVLYGSW